MCINSGYPSELFGTRKLVRSRSLLNKWESYSTCFTIKNACRIKKGCQGRLWGKGAEREREREEVDEKGAARDFVRLIPHIIWDDNGALISSGKSINQRIVNFTFNIIKTDRSRKLRRPALIGSLECSQIRKSEQRLVRIVEKVWSVVDKWDRGDYGWYYNYNNNRHNSQSEYIISQQVGSVRVRNDGGLNLIFGCSP